MVSLASSIKNNEIIGLSMTFIENGVIEKTENYGYLEKDNTMEVNDSTIFNSCSMSKFVTAMLVLVLVDKGHLHIDENVNNKLKNWKITKNELMINKEVVTLRNLLSHQSGIKDPLDSFTEYSIESGIPLMYDVLNGVTDYCSSKIEVVYEPESQFQYSDAGYCVIQQLIEDVMGESFEKIMRKYVLEPLELKNSHYFGMLPDENIASGHDKLGNIVENKYTIYPFSAACGLWSTSSDFAMLIIELMNAIKGSSKLGISSKNARDLIQPQGNYQWAGLGVFLDCEEKELEISSLGWGKGYQCMMVAYPHLARGLVIMTNTDLGVHQMDGIIGEIYKEYRSSF